MDKKVIHSVFEHIASQTPESTALNDKGIGVSYRELNGYANYIAYALAELAVDMEEPVCTYLPSGTAYISSILGINKAGGVFVPLEYRHPVKRLSFIFAEIKPRIVIASIELKESLRGLISEPGCYMPEVILWISFPAGKLEISVQEQNAERAVGGYPVGINPLLRVNGDHANYILYTSGSTGQPKAIVGCQKSLSHFIHWEMQEFKAGPYTKTAQLAPVSFDVSLRDIFVPLLSGGQVCIPPAGLIEHPFEFVKWIGHAGITLMHMVPSVFRVITQEIKTSRELLVEIGTLDYILLAGEPLYARDIVDWRAIAGEKIQLVNLYGPSETTLAKVFNRIEAISTSRNSIIPLGQPISNTAVLIIKDGKLCEIGKIGEICIKTPFRTKGYFNDQTLTREKFVQNPLHNDYEDIIYKTGDLGKYNEERNIEFVGRKDDQIKIMGNRVELAEIERVLMEDLALSNPKIVIVQDENAAPVITCYILDQVPFVEMEVRERLKQYLPEYMHPAFYVQLKEFPLTLNGKIDKKALPKPALSQTKLYEPPANPIEFKLQEIWCQVLALPRVSRSESFFSAGGSSLKAIQIISRIYKEMGVLLKIGELFSLATIKDIGKFIYNTRRKEFKPIEQVPQKDDYELSQAQKRIHFINQFEGGEMAFNIQNAYTIEGAVNAEVLEMAFRKLIERHESLRTVFISVDGKVRQKILLPGQLNFRIEFITLTGAPNPLAAAKERIKALSGWRFNLQEGPLFKVSLMQLEDLKYVLLLTINHIISDGWSTQILNNEVLEQYHALSKNTEPSLPPLSIQYKDFAAWQNNLIVSGNIDAHKQYWLSVFDDEIPVIELPYSGMRPVVQTFEGDMAKFTIDPETTTRLKALAHKEDSTLFMVLMAALNTFFYKYTAQTDFVLGTPAAGRDHPDVEGQIGVFVNTLAIRTQFSGNDTFSTLLKNVKQSTTGAFEHQAYPFDFLVEDLNLKRDLGRSPLFDVMVVMYENVKSIQPAPDGLELSFVPFELVSKTSRYDLTFEMVETAGILQINLEYNTSLFNQSFISSFVNAFKSTLVSVASNPTQAISSVAVMDTQQRTELLQMGKGKIFKSSEKGLLSERFKRIAEAFPARTALTYGDRRITYQELNARANEVALQLQAKNVGFGEVVAVIAKPVPEMIIGLLALVKLGATFLPLDPESPSERSNNMLLENHVRLCLTHRMNFPEFWQVEPLVVDAFGNAEPGHHVPNYPEHQGELLQYVLYTSGSTGKPKGVAIRNDAFINYVDWVNSFICDDRSGYNTALLVSPTFDYAYSSIFATLLRGDTLTLFPDGELNKMLVLAFAPESGHTCLEVTPAHINLLKTIGLTQTKVEKVLIGGEELRQEHIDFLRGLNPKIEVFNLYGPTEGTIASSGVRINQHISIGRPVYNMDIYLLDEALNLVPPGAMGEVCISGRGLASHYVGDIQLTEAKFCPLPWDPAVRVYRTGDLGCWLPDGNLQYKGRRDSQVKIRGFRVEPAEITHALLQLKSVENAVVITAKDPGGDKKLVAFLVGPQIEPSSLRQGLLQKLPLFMVPEYFQVIDFIPVTPHGKTDYRKLNSLFNPVVTTRYVEPETVVQEKLVAIWMDVLGAEAIGIEDTFFDLGGHSIKASLIISKIQKAFDVRISLTALFRKPTIKLLAEDIEVALWATAQHDKKENASAHEFML